MCLYFCTCVGVLNRAILFWKSTYIFCLSYGWTGLYIVFFFTFELLLLPLELWERPDGEKIKLISLLGQICMEAYCIWKRIRQKRLLKTIKSHWFETGISETRFQTNAFMNMWTLSDLCLTFYSLHKMNVKIYLMNTLKKNVLETIIFFL